MSAEAELVCPSWASLIPVSFRWPVRVLSVSLAAWVYSRAAGSATVPSVPMFPKFRERPTISCFMYKLVVTEPSLFPTVRAVRLALE